MGRPEKGKDGEGRLKAGVRIVTSRAAVRDKFERHDSFGSTWVKFESVMDIMDKLPHGAIIRISTSFAGPSRHMTICRL